MIQILVGFVSSIVGLAYVIAPKNSHKLNYRLTPGYETEPEPNGFGVILLRVFGVLLIAMGIAFLTA